MLHNIAEISNDLGFRGSMAPRPSSWKLWPLPGVDQSGNRIHSTWRPKGYFRSRISALVKPACIPSQISLACLRGDRKLHPGFVL